MHSAECKQVSLVSACGIAVRASGLLLCSCSERLQRQKKKTNKATACPWDRRKAQRARRMGRGRERTNGGGAPPAPHCILACSAAAPAPTPQQRHENAATAISHCCALSLPLQRALSLLASDLPLRSSLLSALPQALFALPPLHLHPSSLPSTERTILIAFAHHLHPSPLIHLASLCRIVTSAMMRRRSTALGSSNRRDSTTNNNSHRRTSTYK